MNVLDILVKNGYEYYYVGGFVRDYLLGNPSFDVDIATMCNIKSIDKLLNHKGKMYKDYMSYHINDEYYNYEITTFRKESNYKNNKPSRVYQAYDLYEDLLRRDFTINTFAMDNEGNIIDLLNAKKDLDKKLIKVVGNTYERLTEDNTRILRAIRFCVTLDFKLDNEIINFIKEKGSMLLSLKKEYIKSELDKIFSSDNRMKFFDIVSKYKLNDYLHINYDKIVETDSYGLWAQIESDLPFNKDDKLIIKEIKKLINKNNIDIFDVYKYGEYVSNVAASILHINIDDITNNIPIRSFMDIDISRKEILDIVGEENINKVFKRIEKDILLGKVDNDKKTIIKYIREVIK